MIDFQAIRNELNKISDFIGGEKYIQFKTSDNINVYNKYDSDVQGSLKALASISTSVA